MKDKAKLSRKMTNFVVERAKDKTATDKEVAIRAGYAPKYAKQKGWQIAHDERVQERISRLVDVGLDALEDVATHGRNEIARAAAGKTLVETGIGKPKDNKSTTFGDITINVARIDPSTLQSIAAHSSDT